MTTFQRLAAGLAIAVAAGCQQKMAEQPSPRPYEEYAASPGGQSARPLENGVVARGSRGPDDPMVSWLTDKGKAPQADPAWKQQVDPAGQTAPPPGAPTDVANYVNEFPFEMTEADLKVGQTKYNIYCGVCHGATGAGNGKIVERGYLRPPSYHADPKGVAKDYAINAKNPSDGLPQGHSRGFGRYGKLVRIDEVPVGYIFQVITWGYGGMPDLGWQVPAEDRWRIIAYIRALQLSQGGAKVGDLPTGVKERVEAGLTKDKKPAGGH